ncbi:MAG: rhamnulokinase [Armatimonadetes bacterium CG_4_10_14_3_um_filter_66_18]|nr:rhamnulokinase [Armatimonadota bacterium]OIP00310.1 MAG: rhamnulokinase [Armatimonadetes bacterium CG2_30_66_41]PIU92364.1 MAG: rhamnulokinase [Armatimonadetes bacterium CG06_land_8_20_14_3_00_66_21]PIX38317.1 MAG: rhamnulokinase [Armatimonadetes bacterium CG_4_8_14_3_um_filter_66_20]PIY49652.1 MAG: rhamnulokinase [Armatimonadetes bacterium CG_4_10_14_3_um_filter_66_18]PIZ46312.1 MAG: rhamnulokinase [Armatimonadetes bacterium CG_4_10_14_0_8_um_filter_66_14]PJB72148.1 MAG: rhamnulokinase [A
MSAATRYLAIDLGAESGRGLMGTLEGGRLSLEEVHRFANGPVDVLGSLHWNVLGMYGNIRTALAHAADKCGGMASARGGRLDGIGIDTWGVDFGLLDSQDKLLGTPFHYRDSRTDGIVEAACRLVPKAEIFDRTGIQFMQLNTLFQLVSMVLSESPQLEIAETMLMMPDLFNFLLTGEKATEFSIATTSQMYDPRLGDWSRELCDKLGIPTRILQGLVPSGSVIGNLLPSLGDETGLGAVPVIAPACHDTGSAVAAVPMVEKGACYLSSGTWSLVGVELDKPLINDRVAELNFTNEGGVNGTIRFLKNIMGLWLVQESRRQWEREGESLSYDDLTQAAEAAEPFRSLLDPDDELFLKPGDMPAQIGKFCVKTDQPVPETKGQLVRAALESLALKYRWVVERLEEVTNNALDTIHIVGGGSQNALLNQLAADCTGRRVLAGPVEATAIGNILVQAVAREHLGSIAEARQIVRDSFDLAAYEPQTGQDWDAAYARFVELT